jgi:hypothetical protein
VKDVENVQIRGQSWTRRPELKWGFAHLSQIAADDIFRSRKDAALKKCLPRAAKLFLSEQEQSFGRSAPARGRKSRLF